MGNHTQARWGGELRTVCTATLVALSIHKEPVAKGASGYWLTTIDDFVVSDLTLVGDSVAVGGNTDDQEPTIMVLDDKGEPIKNITFVLSYFLFMLIVYTFVKL